MTGERLCWLRLLRRGGSARGRGRAPGTVTLPGPDADVTVGRDVVEVAWHGGAFLRMPVGSCVEARAERARQSGAVRFAARFVPRTKFRATESATSLLVRVNVQQGYERRAHEVAQQLRRRADRSRRPTLEPVRDAPSDPHWKDETPRDARVVELDRSLADGGPSDRQAVPVPAAVTVEWVTFQPTPVTEELYRRIRDEHEKSPGQGR